MTLLLLFHPTGGAAPPATSFLLANRNLLIVRRIY